MGRREKGQKVDGWLVLDKPIGMTSTEAVARVKRLFDAQKVGHAGTLDPLAYRLPADRARRGDQDRVLRDGRPKDLPLHGALRGGDDDRRHRGAGGRELGQAAVGSGNPRDPPGVHRAHHADSAALLGGEDRRRAGLRPGARGRGRDARAARDSGAPAGAYRVPRCGERRVPCRMRQGHLCAGARARHGTPARRLRPCRRAPPPGRRAVRRGADDFAGKAGGVAP